MAPLESSRSLPAKPFGPAEESALRESLRRCSPVAVEAAVEFRKTGNPALLPTVVLGIIERFLEPERRQRLREGGDDLRVIEDLGVDSLTLMEIVLLVEESTFIQVKNEELRNLRTIGDLKAFIDARVRGLPPPEPPRFIPLEEIAARMPQQPPFLFLDEASVSASSATGKYLIRGSESFLQGHFKNNPVFPASILLEALGQLGVLFLLEKGAGESGQVVDPARIFFTSCEGVRCHRVCKPGDVLALTVKPRRVKMPLATFEGSIRVAGEKAAFAEEITLTFAFTAEAPAAPGADQPAGPSAPAAPSPSA